MHRESWPHIPCHFFQTIHVSSPFSVKFGFQGRLGCFGLCLSKLCWDSFSLQRLALHLCTEHFEAGLWVCAFFRWLKYDCKEFPFILILKKIALKKRSPIISINTIWVKIECFKCLMFNSNFTILWHHIHIYVDSPELLSFQACSANLLFCKRNKCMQWIFESICVPCTVLCTLNEIFFCAGQAADPVLIHMG